MNLLRKLLPSLLLPHGLALVLLWIALLGGGTLPLLAALFRFDKVRDGYWATLFLVIFLITYVVPNFAQLYSSMQAQLPKPTLILIASLAARRWGVLVAGWKAIRVHFDEAWQSRVVRRRHCWRRMVATDERRRARRASELVTRWRDDRIRHESLGRFGNRARQP